MPRSSLDASQAKVTLLQVRPLTRGLPGTVGGVLALAGVREVTAMSPAVRPPPITTAAAVSMAAWRYRTMCSPKCVESPAHETSPVPITLRWSLFVNQSLAMLVRMIVDFEAELWVWAA